MVQSYDFDIHWLIPHEAEADPAIGALLDTIGFNGNSRSTCIALFRDPQVVAMIERADPVLRAYLKASGFGFSASQSGTQAGYFPAEDATARTDVIARLDENLGQVDFKGADLGGFDFGAFLKAMVEGKPLPADDPTPRVAAKPTSALDQPDVLAMPTGYAKLSGRNRVLPLMVLSLAVMLGVYWLIQSVEALPAAF